jgi:peptide/nickel transport system substrate-binding protein
VFRLRKGVLFHNGREVDAEAVKLNLMRIKDPTIGGDWERGAVDTIESVEVLDKYTVRINATMPDVSLPSNVMHYPTRLMAPDAFDTAAEHPIGTGPFKFVSWTRNNESHLVLQRGFTPVGYPVGCGACDVRDTPHGFSAVDRPESPAPTAHQSRVGARRRSRPSPPEVT